MFFGAKNHLLSYQPFQFNLYKSPARGYAKRPEVFKISRQRKKFCGEEFQAHLLLTNNPYKPPHVPMTIRPSGEPFFEKFTTFA